MPTYLGSNTTNAELNTVYHQSPLQHVRETEGMLLLFAMPTIKHSISKQGTVHSKYGLFLQVMCDVCEVVQVCVYD